MKVVEEISRGALTIGGGEVVNISIAANSNIIRDVIKNIYSQKEKTVVRELMANAFDAHVVAGIVDQPIDVVLPTRLDPIFSVRDFGVGMDHDFVLRLYSSLGFSTKGDSNDQTGMFGVGSKSPLSITDSFTVRCFDKPNDEFPEGRVRLYSVFFADNGSPQLKHTFTVAPRPEDRVHLGGTEVKVPVSGDSINKIADGLYSQQMIWFDKAVNVDGNSTFSEAIYTNFVNVCDGLYLFGLKTREMYSPNGLSRVFVRQGSAVYPVNDSEIGYKVNSTTRKLFAALCGTNYHVMVDLPIGTVDVTMAREEVQYNPISTQNLIEAIETAASKLNEVFNEVIGEDIITYAGAIAALAAFFEGKFDPTDLAAAQRMNALSDVFAKIINKNYDKFHDSLPKSTKMREKYDTTTHTHVVDANGDPVMEAYEADAPYVPPKSSFNVKATDFNSLSAILCSMRTRGQSTYNSVSQRTISNPHIFYVIPSHTREWRDRVTKHVGSDLKQMFKIDENTDPIDITVVRVGKKMISDTLDSIRNMGVIHGIVLEEHLPASSENSAKRAQYSRSAVFQWDKNRSGWSADKVEPAYDALAYYVVRDGLTDLIRGIPTSFFHNGAAYLPLRQIGESSLINAIRAAELLQAIDADTPIYRVTTKQLEKMVDTNVWQNVLEAMAPALIDAHNATEVYPYPGGYYARVFNSDFNPLLLETNQAVIECLGEKTLQRLVYDREIMDLLRKHDPEFCFFVALRRAFKDGKPTPDFADLYPEVAKADYRITAGYNAIFTEQPTKRASIDALEEKTANLSLRVTDRYEILAGLDSNTRYSGREHLLYYVRGLVANTPPVEVAADSPIHELTTYEPAVKRFNELLDTALRIEYQQALAA